MGATRAARPAPGLRDGGLAADTRRHDRLCPPQHHGTARKLWEKAVAHVTARSAREPLDPALRVTVHFHPDRLFEGESILATMARDGVYRSQFETGTSNGGLTAFPGGDRWRWESRIFGGAYDAASPEVRPKYGSLQHRGRAARGAPRVGPGPP